MAQRSLVVNFIGDSKQLEATFKRVGTQMNAMQRAGSGLQSVGSGMTRNLTLPIVAVGVAAGKMAMDFQASTERLRTQAGATQKQVEQLRSGILNMASAVGTSPDALSKGMYHVVSSMNAILPPTHRAQAELGILKAAAEGAQIGNSDLEETTYALASAMNAMHLQAKDANSTMGTLNAIVGAGDMTMTDLIDSLQSGLLPTARIAGLSLQSVGAALAVMGDMGMRGALAGTRLRMSIALLSSPSSAAAKVLQTLGLKAHQATSTSQAMADALQKAGLRTTQLGADLRKPDGFMVALKDLNDHLRASGLTATGAAAVMNKAFGGGRMGATISLLAQNTDRLRVKFDQIGATTKQFGKDWQATTQTASFKWHAMLATVQADLIKLGNVVLPIVLTIGHDVAGAVDKVTHAFTSLPKGLQDTIITGGLIVAAVGPAMKILGVFTSGIGRLAALVSFAGKLFGGKSTSDALSRAAGRAVGTMTVNTLIAKTMVGGAGAGGEPGVGGPATTAEKDAAKSKGGWLKWLKGQGMSAGEGAAGAGAITMPETIAALATGAGILYVTSKGFGEIRNLVMGGLPYETPQARQNVKAGALDPTRSYRGLYGQRITPLEPTGVGVGPTQATRTGQEGSVNNYDPPSVKQATRDYTLMNAQLAKLENHQQDIKATAFNLDWLGQQAKKLGDVRYEFADKLGAEMLKTRNVESRGVQQLIGQLNLLPPAARANAQQAMVQMSQTLEQQGRLPRGSTVKLVTDLLNNYKGMRDKGSQYFQSLLQDGSRSMDDLRQRIKTSTGQQRTDAIGEYNALRDGANRAFGQMETNTLARMHQLHNAIVNGSGDAATAAGRNLGDFENSVFTAMRSGLVSATDGANRIGDALNKVLKSFGTKPIPLAVLAASEPKHLPVFVGGGHSGHFAGGGVMQIGREGERGRDTIPLNVGGQGIVVGAGEQVAVFNHDQQRAINQDLAHKGGLPGFFAQHKSLHYMASGGLVGSGWQNVVASAESLGGDGYMGNPIQPFGYSELSVPPSVAGAGSAMGHLPYLTHMRIRAGDHEVVAAKQDIGAGSSFDPVMGLYPGTVSQLGLSGGEFHVSIERADGVPLTIGGAAAAAAIAQIAAPMVNGTGTVASMVRGALGLEANAANAYLSAHMPTGGGGALGAIPNFPVASGPLPPAVQKASEAARFLLGRPYVTGGFGFDASGLDCSGYVSTVMNAAGLMNGYLITGPLKTWGDAGPGKWITVGVLGADSGPTGHAMMEIDGTYFESGGGGGGPHIDSTPWGGQSFQWFRHPPGLAAGGLVDPAPIGAPGHQLSYDGWLSKRNEHHTTGYGRGGLFAASGFLSHSTNSSAKPKAPKQPPHHKQAKPPKLPNLKTLPAFDQTLLNQIASTDTTVQELGNWYSYLDSLYGAPGVESLVTLADGSQVVNPGLGPWPFDPSGYGMAGLTDLTGMVDPATGQLTRSIWDRLRDIGQPGTLDQNTLLGVDDRMLFDLYAEQALAGKASGALGPWLTGMMTRVGLEGEEIGWLQRATDATTPFDRLGPVNFRWLGGGGVKQPGQPGFPGPAWFGLPLYAPTWGDRIREKAREYKNMLAQIEWATKLKEGLPIEKQRRDYNITKRFADARHRIQVSALTSSFDGSQLLSEQDAALSEEQRQALSGISSSTPRGWKGDRVAWSLEHQRERADIEQEFSDRKAALHRAAAAHNLAGRLSRSNALFGLSQEEAAEKLQVGQTFGSRENTLKDLVRSDTQLKGTDKAWLGHWLSSIKSTQAKDQTALHAATDTGGFRDQLKDYLDPMGALSIAILTKRNIDIPALGSEIADLTGTKVPVATNAAANAATLTGTTAFQYQGQEVIAGMAAGGMLPPFGGSFAAGGMVPGAPGEPRLIVAHGGEEFLGVNGERRPVASASLISALGRVEAALGQHEGSVRQLTHATKANTSAKASATRAGATFDHGRPSTASDAVLSLHVGN